MNTKMLFGSLVGAAMFVTPAMAQVVPQEEPMPGSLPNTADPRDTMPTSPLPPYEDRMNPDNPTDPAMDPMDHTMGPPTTPMPTDDAMPDRPAVPPAGETVPSTVAPTIDSDGDGIMDAWDRDRDTRADAWDTTGDGMPDMMDDDYDGQPDMSPM